MRYIFLFFTLFFTCLNASEKAKFFSLKVYPLLKEKCFGCHGDQANKIKGGLDLKSIETIRIGGDSGEPALIPGQAEKSLIYQSVLWEHEDMEMPPKENDRLTEIQCDIIKKWIDQGAVWVEESIRQTHLSSEMSKMETAEGRLVLTSGGQDESWTYRRYKKEDLWAYLPFKKTSVPQRVNPVDFFVHQRLKGRGLQQAPESDRRTLIRRVTYDLTGLPPTPEEVEDFIDDTSSSAWEKVVDRLLTSLHYGEKWGQLWLDVVRYSDTSGFSSDWEKSNAWRYRDYVIRSFNQDKPIDQFFREQLAGDELNNKNPEMLVATGFLRMGPYGTAMIAKEEARQQYLDDVTNSIGETFLGHALKCAKCHDHKFDPIPTKDYYAIQAVFASTHPGEMKADYLEEENTKGFEEGRDLIEKRLEEAKKDKDQLYEKMEAAAKRWFVENHLDYISREKRKDLPEDKKPPRSHGLNIQEQGFLKVREQDVRMYTRRLERYQPMAQSVYHGNFHLVNEIKLRPPKNIHTAKMQQAPKTFVLSGGSLGAKGDEVTPGVLSLLQMKAKIPANFDQRRKAFANWLTRDDNVLVLRTFVNRVWQGHFGRGLAANPNNLGKTGAKPTYQDVLDALCLFFVEQGWSTKKLHKLILMSQTYRMSSHHPNPSVVSKIDPENKLLSSFEIRRLSAEELRDSILKVTGELNPEMGGLPIFPEINLDVALQPRMLQFSLAPAYQPSRTPEQRHRRSIYAYQTRGMPVPFMSVFNKPNADDSCEQRDSSSVTPQVFTLFNSDNSYDRSVAFALRLERQAKTLEDQVQLAFQLAFGRLAEPDEVSFSIEHIKDRISYHQTHQPEQKFYPTSIKRLCVEEFSGEGFEYQEKLDIYEDFVSDSKLWDVDPETRALADLALVLINSNEFIYIY